MSHLSPFVVSRPQLEQYLDAVKEALCALGDQDAILERGHWGKDDRATALLKLKAVKGVLETALKPEPDIEIRLDSKPAKPFKRRR